MADGTAMSDIVQLQDYLYLGLRSCALFDAFNVVQEKEYLASSVIKAESLWITPRTAGGKVGAGLLVKMPALTVPKPNSLQRNLLASIVAIENRNINLMKNGTGVACEDLAELALDFMFGWVMGFSSALSPEAGGVAPAPDELNGPGLVCYKAQLSLRREHRAVARCDVPVLSMADGLWQMANGARTPDAAIYYTLDGTMPGAENKAAVLYAGPLGLAAGQVITFAAWREDLLPSHVSSQVIS
jgi:hypothetical protein